MEGRVRGRVAHRDPRCSPMSRSAACVENGHAVIATSAQLKTPISDSSPSVPQSPFQPQPENKHFPLHYSPSKLYSARNPILLAHAPGPLYVVTLQRKQSYWMLWTSRANLIQASSLLRLHTMFTTALLIESRQVKRTNPSLYAPQALNDREEMSHYGCLTLGFLSRSCTMPWPNLSSAERNGDKASFWLSHFVFFNAAPSYPTVMQCRTETKLSMIGTMITNHRHGIITLKDKEDLRTCGREQAEW